MFLHSFKYGLLTSIRNKTQIMWSLLFVIALGTLFKLAFENIYNNDERLQNIGVAVYIEDEEVSENFKSYLADVSLVESGDKLLDITYTESMEEAEKLLYDKKVKGIYYSEAGELKLQIAKEDIQQSILASLTTEYHQIMVIMTDTAMNNPEKMQKVMATLMGSVSTNQEIMNSDSDMNTYTQYFYNLIAMACIMSVSAGVMVTINNHANTSTIGARKQISSANSFISNFSSLLATALVNILCVLISFGYLNLIGIRFGGSYPKIFLIIAVAIFCGISIGFYIGSLGKISYKAKDGIATAVSVGGSFLSGLMVANMRMLVEKTCPIINRINPVALVADSFYANYTFNTDDRLIRNLISLLVIAAVFIVLGNIVGRRKQYDSI